MMGHTTHNTKGKKITKVPGSASEVNRVDVTYSKSHHSDIASKSDENLCGYFHTMEKLTKLDVNHISNLSSQ